MAVGACEHLLLATREQTGTSFGQGCERGEQVKGAGGIRATVGPQIEVLLDGQGAEQAAILGDEAEPGPGDGIGRSAGQILAVEGHVPGEWAEHPGNGEQRRGLAGPVGAEQAHDLAPAHRQIDSMDDGGVAVACYERADVESCGAHVSTVSEAAAAAHAQVTGDHRGR